MAAEEASFKTEILSISFGSTTFISPSTPSIKTIGLDTLNDPKPRIKILPVSLPGCPPALVTVTPGAKPCKPWETFDIGLDAKDLESTDATAPVMFTFFCEP